MNPALEARIEIEKAWRQRQLLLETGRSQKPGEQRTAITVLSAFTASYRVPSKQTFAMFKDRMWKYLSMVVIGGGRGKKHLDRIKNLIQQVQ